MPPDNTTGTVPLDPNDPDNLRKLQQEDEPPDAPPDDVHDTGSDHPQKDTNVTSQEVVDVGEDAAAGISDPLKSGPPKDYAPAAGDQEGYDGDGTEEAAADNPSGGVS